MKIEEVEHIIKSTISSEIKILPEGVDRYKIFSPFEFDDGDRIVIVLKKINNKYCFTDEGHTYMHLSYNNDISSFEKGNRAQIISSVLNSFNLIEDRGALIHYLGEANEWGNSLYNYIQALIKITDISFLSRERVK